MKTTLKIVDVQGVKYLGLDREGTKEKLDGFDWGLDPEEVEKLKFACANDPHMTESYIGNVKNHFVECFSEFIGRPISLKEINDAIESEEIEYEKDVRI